jgi:hypothetical protein
MSPSQICLPAARHASRAGLTAKVSRSVGGGLALSCFDRTAVPSFCSPRKRYTFDLLPVNPRNGLGKADASLIRNLFLR